MASFRLTLGADLKPIATATRFLVTHARWLWYSFKKENGKLSQPNDRAT